MELGASVIAETDDDNLPYETFLADVSQEVEGVIYKDTGWVNVYSHFTNEFIWPRGFPLEHLSRGLRLPRPSGTGKAECVVQQFLADGDPDVDAVHRLVFSQTIRFGVAQPVILQGTSFCPFNSQNTVWWPAAFVLMYLPAHVTFRMTDIWRSFVAQVCLQAAGQSIAFLGPSVIQDRNAHSLLRDFEDEIPGYLNNSRIIWELSALQLSDDPANVAANLRACYMRLVEIGVVPATELELLQAWMADVEEAQQARSK